MSDLMLTRTDSGHADFRELVVSLDKYLSVRDGDEHTFYALFNKIDSIKNVVVACQNKILVACGAIKPYDEKAAEVKRMFVHPDYGKTGLATKILTEIENRAKELGLTECVLETVKNGRKQLLYT